jgi:hypothetical protein
LDIGVGISKISLCCRAYFEIGNFATKCPKELIRKVKKQHCK